jgi:RNA polymerase sigma-32 factor
MRAQERSSYLEELKPESQLTALEEQELARGYQAGDANAGQRLVRAHIRFVYRCAHSYRGYGLSFEDLVQEGNIGLLQAVRRFDPDRGFRLISYAVHWIRAQMQSYVVQQFSMVRIGTSQVQRKLFYRLRREAAAMQDESATGDAPDDDALAERLAVSPRSVTEMRKRLLSRDVSLDAKPFDDSDRTVASSVPSGDASPEEEFESAQLAKLVRDRVPGLLRSELDDRERYILDLRLFQDQGDSWTLERIGKTLGITRERTRQLEARAKAKLRQGLLDLVA